MIIIGNLNFIIFCVIVSLLTKLLTLGIFFSTAVRVVVMAKLTILSISPLASLILEEEKSS